MNQEPKHEDQKFRTGFVLLLVLGVSILFLQVIWPLAKPLLLAALLAAVCRPIFLFFVRWFRGRRSLASVMTLLILLFITIGPVSAFLGVVVKQAVGVSSEAIPWVQKQLGAGSAFDPHEWLVGQFPSVSAYVPSKQQIMESVGSAAQLAGGYVVAGLSRMTARTAAFLLDLFVMFYAFFYFLRDGVAIMERILYYMPLNHEDEARMLERLGSVTRATIKGTMVIALIQGSLAGLGFWVAGIEGAAFWGTVMVVLSVVPGIGSALVWVPGVIYLFIAGKTLAAILLAAWCAVVVGTIDNVLRPTLVGKDARMPDLLILVGTIGGLYLFGPMGFIVGPLVCGLFLTVWEIYGRTFREILPPVKSLRTGKLMEPPRPLEKNDENDE